MPYRRRQQDAAHAFAWPPTREDLDLIEIVDPDTLRPVQTRANEPEPAPVQLDLLKSVTPVRPVCTPLPLPVSMPDTLQVTGFAPLVLVRPPHAPAQAPVPSTELTRLEQSASPLLPFPARRRLDPTWIVATCGLCAIALSAYFSLHPAPTAVDVDSAIATPVSAAPVPRLIARPLSPIELSSWLPVASPPPQPPPPQIARATPPRTASPKIDGPKPAPAVFPRTRGTRDADTRSASGSAVANATRPAAVAPKPLGASTIVAGGAAHVVAPVSAVALDLAAAAAPAPAIVPASVSVPAAKPAPAGREMQQQVYAALQEYERGYERLDANAVRAVWPSVDARALARAFHDLKSQTLVFDRCDIDVARIQAVAACHGRATYETRAGEQASRTEPRQWTFKLRKSDEAWQIVSASAR